MLFETIQNNIEREWIADDVDRYKDHLGHRFNIGRIDGELHLISQFIHHKCPAGNIPWSSVGIYYYTFPFSMYVVRDVFQLSRAEFYARYAMRNKFYNGEYNGEIVMFDELV